MGNMRKRPYATDLRTLERETEVAFYKSSGPGGQKKNKTESSVRLHHTPSGLIIIATEQRSQAQNRVLAFRRLQRKLVDLNRVPKPRIKMQISQESKARMVEAKKKLAEKKRLRQANEPLAEMM
ncbi:MAG: peptide chain release factor-like protein [Nitrospirae bacterium]|nr:peptide chain release factor-like protein [Candidatus Manganitrophaceae bacterium]